MSKMNIIAIIPARGGSKGIPKKNLARIQGKTLIARSIAACQESKSISQIYVSTDCPDIHAEAVLQGASVSSRPESLSSDKSTSEDALIYTLEDLRRQGIQPDILVFLQCTSPFTTGEQIDVAINKLIKEDRNSVFSVKPWHGFLWTKEGEGINHDPNSQRKRRQDLDAVFVETGALYVLRVTPFIKQRNRFCKPTLPVVFDDNNLDIDNEFDLLICQSIADQMNY